MADKQEKEKPVSNTMQVNDFGNRIYTIRGKQVMLDYELAALYGYEVRALNQQVKRNIERFPDDFMFQLTKEEVEGVKSQFVISPFSNFYAGQEGGRRKPPYAFTEQGIYMLATVLKGKVAEQQSIFIMRAFREMRQFISNNALLFEKISHIELKQLEYQKSTNEKLEKVFQYIEDQTESKQKIFFDGQIYDAFSFITSIVQKAQNEIILIDGYVDVGTLNILAKKNATVDVKIYTYASASITNNDIVNFNAQYPTLTVEKTQIFHDRFIILDGKTVYHIGASLKDAGKKCFAISLLEDTENAMNLINRLNSI
ncbi:phage regulator Rha-like protein [Oribacterium sinus]|jgi:toxin-antitoxin system, toxin component, fic family|uniref:Phage regulator Rha-like protein n=1 Tax=Oribacterium sinus TaxID=237576 RepID=A0A7W9SFH6_9FIRM|nr:ORF6N domain-containing protein [Oribacterium sinus]MBB6041213.1 phage regulator Rha-like protein [Oribacterium sinus]